MLCVRSASAVAVIPEPYRRYRDFISGTQNFCPHFGFSKNCEWILAFQEEEEMFASSLVLLIWRSVCGGSVNTLTKIRIGHLC